MPDALLAAAGRLRFTASGSASANLSRKPIATMDQYTRGNELEVRHDLQTASNCGCIVDSDSVGTLPESKNTMSAYAGEERCVLIKCPTIYSISMCALSFFDEADRRQKNRFLRFFCCSRRTTTPQEQGSKQRIETSVSSIEFDKDERIFMVPEARPSHFEREQWLQRRNSLSSQRAIHPHRHHYYDPRTRYVVYSYAPSARYSSTLRSVSEGHCLGLSDRNSSFTSSESSGSLARSARLPPAAISSSHRSSSSLEKPGSGSRNGVVGGGVAAGGGVIPPVHDVPSLPAPPPPMWSPALQHAPLSSDPTIQALSTGTQLSHPRSSPALLETPSESSPCPSSASSASSTLAPISGPLIQTSGIDVKTKAKRQENRPETGVLAQQKNHRPPTPPQTTQGPVSTVPPTSPPPPPPLTIPPPPPPVVTPDRKSPPSVALPPLPTRSPGHNISPFKGTRGGGGGGGGTRSRPASTSPSRTNTTTAPSPNSLRRPSPLRSVHRQYYAPQQYQRYVPGGAVNTHGSGMSGTRRYASGQGYGYGSGYGYVNGSSATAPVLNSALSVSMYSASSYGTDRSRSTSLGGGGIGGRK
ncbi:hypothetical protein PV08_02538 [Exophiala spinifera]|uniref:Uncharacterized protein n=1 Tax=Exophiala spinifera TaxID=91928 RepID=A0A0D2BHX6_9EURO|nr:uncharacterized protein PV08_02538 [Exophiala spinifera]KIW18250.1 hypothetical protein PV08_02538 [Exophiala spinifera]